MKSLKDNNTTGYKGQANSTGLKVFSGYELPNYYNVPEHQRFIDCAHKSQKIVTAIYMITDLVVEGDPLVQQLRSHVVTVMNKLYSLTALPQAQRVQELSETSTLIYALSSYLQVLLHSAKVSSMNHTLIANELSGLQEHINVLLTKNLPYDRQQRSSQLINEFSFSDDFFKTSSPTKNNSEPMPKVRDNRESPSLSVKDIDSKKSSLIKDNESNSIKDTADSTRRNDGEKNRETQVEKDTFTVKSKTNNSSQERSQRTLSKGHYSEIKAEKKSSEHKKGSKDLRHENILKILKQKKDAKIGDITSLITDCGSKTIQRDLNELVKKELVIKEGERRWSVYNLAY